MNDFRQIPTVTVSVPEAAHLLGISRAGAYNAVKSGDLPSVRVRGRVLIPKHRLARLLDGESEPSAPRDGLERALGGAG